MLLTKQFDTLFLDRDGIFNEKIENGYVLQIDDIKITDGIADFLKLAKGYFKRIVVITNQRCVGRGMLPMVDLININNTINLMTGSMVDKFYICPHLDEDDCDCRKPKDGLFKQVAADFEVDFQNSWMIGDSETDLIPAKKLGIFTVFISTKDSVFADEKFNTIKELNSSLF
jgi:D-glycero-D-manno-heptose 1,7-bisphosphate phosphatase